MIHSPKGSEWHRWDLHIHTPETKLSNSYTGNAKEDLWEKYITMLEESPVDVFGVTDYFSCDNYFTLLNKYKKQYSNSSKVFFPNIEFRLSETISKNNTKLDLHVIFDNDPKRVPQEKILLFLQNLKTFDEDDSNVQIACSSLKTKTDYESASVAFKDVLKALNDTFGQDKPYFLIFPAGNDGLRSTDNNSPRKVKISDNIDEKCNFFFGSEKNKAYLLKTDRYASGKESEPKPVVSGSDAHSFEDLERLDGHVTNYPPTWIKADLTFRGLQQICFEPDSRVVIDLEVPVNQRKVSEPTKFISRLQIDQIDNYKEKNGEWFKGVDIPINSELTTIIGNKGSGKSALVDIIGLLGETKLSNYFSFLTDEPKNRKFKQPGFAENFSAKLVWESNQVVSKKLLSDVVDEAEKEKVRYLPQNYFEQLTNDLEIDAFRKEIEDVVFSHVEETDRMGKISFKELEEFKNLQSKHSISSIKARLRELNIEIVALEEQANPLTLRKLENGLIDKKKALKSLIKPKEVEKPSEETPDQKKISDAIINLSEQLAKLKKSGEEKVDEVTQKKSRLQKLISLQEGLQELSSHVSNRKLELKSLCQELELNIDIIVKVDIDTKVVTESITACKKEIAELELDSHLEFSDDSDLNSLESLPDLRNAYKFIKNKTKELKNELGTPQRKYQVYIESVVKWEDDKLKILGEEDNPNSETIRAFELEIAYIKDDLSQKINERYEQRKGLSQEIFNSKKNVLSFYSSLKKSVDEKLDSVRTAEFDVDIKASFVIDNSFEKSFLSFINQGFSGPFKGKVEGMTALRNILKLVDWNNFDSVFSFIETVMSKMKGEESNSLLINNQVNNVKQFYDFLFSLDYFSAKYELRLGDKNLNELSPGEKGMLLLVFYLQLDKDNIPLIIDQPEDNLDNDSIFAVLAKCIREAKKNRQVILVTHNPNLAVGADAEQIIYVKLEKAKNYKFSCESGSIENPQINKRIVKVLEGSQPAFVKRRLKYQIK